MKDKIYYCNTTGKILCVIANIVNVKETTFDEDYSLYTILNERDKDSIGLILLNNGEFERLSRDRNSIKINLDTFELEFENIEVPQEPTEIDKINEKIFNLEKENADLLLDSAVKDIKIETLENDVADIILEIAGGM
ncbi:MAG: hypothetical protein ACRCXT_24050 [Paraclostridium sp.]